MSEIEIREMTEEDMDEMCAKEEMMARLLRFENSIEMRKFQCHAAEGMIKFGGGFSHHLGHALARADMFNAATLIRAFRPVCEEHAQLWRKFIENRNKPVEEGEK